MIPPSSQLCVSVLLLMAAASKIVLSSRQHRPASEIVLSSRQHRPRISMVTQFLSAINTSPAAASYSLLKYTAVGGNITTRRRFGRPGTKGDNSEIKIKRYARATALKGDSGDDNLMSVFGNSTMLNHSKDSQTDIERLPSAEISDMFAPLPGASSSLFEGPASPHPDGPSFDLTDFIRDTNGSSEDAENNFDNLEFNFPNWSVDSGFGTLGSGEDAMEGGSLSLDHDPEICTGMEQPRPAPSPGLLLSDICVGDLRPWSCRNRCNQYQDSSFFGFTCSCHPLCLVHKFCCSDFETECPNEFQNARENVEKFPGISAVCDAGLGAHVVSVCPAGATDAQKRLGEGGPDVSSDVESPADGSTGFTGNASSSTDPSESVTTAGQTRRPSQASNRLWLTAPVSDSVLGWHFKNRFCWECWTTQNQPVVWRMDILISSTSRPAEDYRLETLTEYAERNPETVAWFPPEPLVRVPCPTRFMEEDIAASCSACVVDPATEEACVNGSTNYLRIGSTRFRNHHCYLCSKYYDGGQSSSSHIHDHPAETSDTGNKYNCYSIQFTNRLVFHNMHFPVTMILPDAQSGVVALVQRSDHFNAYTWDTLSCKAAEDTPGGSACVAEKCTSMAVLVDGKCDNTYYPQQAIITTCPVGPHDGYLSCKSSKRETSDLDETLDKAQEPKESLPGLTFRDRFGVELKLLQENLHNMGSRFGAKHFGEFSLINSSIVDGKTASFRAALVWKIKRTSTFSDLMERSMNEELGWEVYKQLAVLRPAEPVRVCVQSRVGLDGRSSPLPSGVFGCNLIPPCGPAVVGESGPRGLGRAGAASRCYGQVLLYYLLFIVCRGIVAAASFD